VVSKSLNYDESHWDFSSFLWEINHEITNDKKQFQKSTDCTH